MQILRIIIFTTLLVSVTAYVLAMKKNAKMEFKIWNKNNEHKEYNGKHKNYTRTNKSRDYIKDTVVRRSYYADPLHLSLAGGTWQLIFLITISMLLFSYLPIYLKMRTKFWPVFINWSLVTFEDYICRPLIAAVTRNSRDNVYQEVYQAYNLPVGFV